MASTQAERTSALAGSYTAGRFGMDGEAGVVFQEMVNLSLGLVAAWPDSFAAVAALAAEAVGAEAAPGPGKTVAGTKGALLRTEPLKFWIVGAAAPELSPEQGASLDLSHSRCHLRVSGPAAAELINRHLPLDLGEASCPVGTVMASAFHHVGVTLWRSEAGFELFLPRGFALSLWEILQDSAAQFGFEVI
ncbi:MAG: sarcosine oxidase subunit gamma [Pseudomonadota bacterium]